MKVNVVKGLALVSIVSLLFTIPVTADANTSAVRTDNTVRVKVNGVQLDFTGDTAPFITSGRTLVPMRKSFEAVGAKVDWDDSKKEVTISKNGNVVKLVIGKGTYTVNGVTKNMETGVVSQIVGGRTVLPARYVAEALGIQVGWDSAERIVLLSTDANAASSNIINGIDTKVFPEGITFTTPYNSNGLPIVLPAYSTSPSGMLAIRSEGKPFINVDSGQDLLFWMNTGSTIDFYKAHNTAGEILRKNFGDSVADNYLKEVYKYLPVATNKDGWKTLGYYNGKPIECQFKGTGTLVRLEK